MSVDVGPHSQARRLGKQEALSYLPCKFISPQDLTKGNYEIRRDIIYIVVFGPEDIYNRIDNTSETIQFDKSEFIKSPELYTSIFESK